MNQLVIFTLKSEKASGFKIAALKSLKNSLKEEGNLDMKLFEDVDNHHILYVYSRWKNQEAYNWHKKQDYTKSLSKLAKSALEEKPRIIELEEAMPFPQYNLQHKNKVTPKETLFFIFKFKEEYRERLLNQFKTHITNTRKEEANLLFDLYTINDINNEFVVYEQWKSKSAIFDVHFKQPYSLKTGELINEAIIGKLEQYMHFVTELK